MKGKILGMTVATGIGAISGEDGKRYSFAAAEWRSDKPVAIGMQVDFDASENAARDIYPAVAGGTAGVDLAAFTASPAAARAKQLITTTLAVPLALLVLVAFFMPALSSPAMGVSQVGIGKAGQMLGGGIGLGGDDTSERLVALAEQEAQVRAAIAQLGPGARSQSYPFDSLTEQLKTIAENRDAVEAQASSQNFFALVDALLILRFIAPIAALILIWFAWKEKPVGRLTLITGAAAMLAGTLTIAFKSAVVGMVTASNPFAGEIAGASIDNFVSIGLGAWLLILAGIALLLSGLGVIRHPRAPVVA